MLVTCSDRLTTWIVLDLKLSMTLIKFIEFSEFIANKFSDNTMIVERQVVRSLKKKLDRLISR